MSDPFDPTSLVNELRFLAHVRQYMRSDGRQRQEETHLPFEHLDTYKEMLRAGYYFEAEVLQTGEVSVTISDGDQDIDAEVVPNGPEVQRAMVGMLNRGLWRKDE